MRIRVIVLGVISTFVISQSVFALTAKALIKGTADDSAISGEAVVTEKDGGVEVEVSVAGAPPGKHGFHIHENGDCADMGKAAGGHYNPDGVMHGMVMKNGFSQAHAGDFGNIEIMEDGTGTLQFFLPHLALSGDKYNVAGKAVILHEKEDDFGQPTGNAGGRIGCGLITVIDEPVAASELKETVSEIGQMMDAATEKNGSPG